MLNENKHFLNNLACLGNSSLHSFVLWLFFAEFDTVFIFHMKDMKIMSNPPNHDTKLKENESALKKNNQKTWLKFVL